MLDKSWKEKAEKLCTIPASGDINYDVVNIYLLGITKFKERLLNEITKVAANTPNTSHFDGLVEALQIIEKLKADGENSID